VLQPLDQAEHRHYEDENANNTEKIAHEKMLWRQRLNAISIEAERPE
jgi:hypothetical protein